MNFTRWALKYSIPHQAVAELQAMLGVDLTPPPAVAGNSESGVQSRVRLQAARAGQYLFRNNVGACQDATGRLIRYGLCNESEKVNKVFKSSDLIGFNPVLIGREHIGLVIAQFKARECKPENWRYSGTERERAQLAFLQLVNMHGGDAKFTTGDL